jgi:hypothetical protein
MALAFDSSRTWRGDLAAVIRDYLDDADSDRVYDPGFRRSPSRDRSLRRELLRIEATLGHLDVEALEHADPVAIDRMAQAVVDDARVASSHSSVVAALGILTDFAAWREEPAPRRRPRRRHAEADHAAPRTPTGTMLALGTQVTAWFERLVVVAFVLVAIGLALALV